MRISSRIPSHIPPARRAPVRLPLPVRYAPQPERFEGSPEQQFGPPLQRLKGREGLSLCGYAYQVSVGTLWQLDYGAPHNEFDIAVPMPPRPHYTLSDMPNLHLLVPSITYSRRLKLHCALTILSGLGFFAGF